jgi:hypothetical protein
MTQSRALSFFLICSLAVAAIWTLSTVALFIPFLQIPSHGDFSWNGSIEVISSVFSFLLGITVLTLRKTKGDSSRWSLFLGLYTLLAPCVFFILFIYFFLEGLSNLNRNIDIGVIHSVFMPSVV